MSDAAATYSAANTTEIFLEIFIIIPFTWGSCLNKSRKAKNERGLEKN